MKAAPPPHHPMRELALRYAAVIRAAWAQRHQLAGPARHADEAAFLPAALALQETPLHPAPRRLAWSLIGLFSAAVAWACIGQVDIVAVAPGRIVVSEHTKTVQPLETSVVRRVLVEDGQAVQAGEVLLELDPTDASANRVSVQELLAAASSEEQRTAALLAAVTTHRAPVLAAGAEAATHAQLITEWQDIQARFAKADAEVNRQQAEAATVHATVAKLQAMLPLLQTREADFRALATQGYVAAHALQDRARERLETERELTVQQARLAATQAALAEAQRGRTAIAAEAARALHDRHEQATTKRLQLQQDQAKAVQRERLTQLTAPVAGVVEQLSVHTTGGVVTPAQPLMVIVPTAAAMTVDVEIANLDIGFVREGQAAEVKLETFPYVKYGTLPATVTRVSADAVVDEKKGAHFAATLALPRTVMHIDGKAVRLTPGMNVTAEIKTGRRRVIEYLVGIDAGSDVIDEQGAAGDVDVLRFGSGIAAREVSVARDGADLLLARGDDRVTVRGHFSGGVSAIEQVVFADGTRWDAQALRQMTNRAPTVAYALADAKVTENMSWTYQIPSATFADVDGDALVFRATMADGSALPGWLRFDSTSRTFTGTPRSADVGGLSLKVTAIDNAGASVAAPLSLQVAKMNHAPAAAMALPELLIDEDSQGIYQLPLGLFSDVDEDILAFGVKSASGGPLPSWLQYDAATRTLSGTPRNADVGQVMLSVTGTDPRGLSAATTLVVRVRNTNDAPIAVGTVADQTARLGQPFEFTLPPGLFADPDVGDTVLYRPTQADGSPLPAWLSFNYGTGKFSAVPPVAGTISVKVVGSDLSGATASTIFSLRIDGPVVTSVSGTSGSDALFAPIDGGTVSGLAGDDKLYGDHGADILLGGAGDDMLFGMAGNDTLDGGAGNDLLIGDSGSDTYLMYRGMGVDRIDDLDVSVGSEDTILVGAGIAPGDLTVSTSDDGSVLFRIKNTSDGLWVLGWLAPRPASAGTQRVERMQFADGTVWNTATLDRLVRGAPTAGNDLLFGDNFSADTIDGLGGNDTIRGLGGDDVLNGGAGGDRLYGGDGNDILDGGIGSDLLYGEKGADTYRLSRGMGSDVAIDVDSTPGVIDTVSVDGGLAPSDIGLIWNGISLYLLVKGTSDQMELANWFAGSNNEVEQVRFADGTCWTQEMLHAWTQPVANDRDNSLFGDDGANTIAGLGGEDWLWGRGGNDLMLGGDGSDNVFAETGNDTLDGGKGNDALYGGAGSDTYLGYRGMGQDLVVEEEISTGDVDVLKFGADITADQIWLRRTGGIDLEISVIGTADRINIRNWYAGYHIEQIITADGKVLLDTQVDRLVQAMAAFSPPAAGQTTLTPDQRTALAPVLAATWTG